MRARIFSWWTQKAWLIFFSKHKLFVITIIFVFSEQFSKKKTTKNLLQRKETRLGNQNTYSL